MIGAVSAWQALRDAVREVAALGAEFRVVGADAEVEGLGGIPAKLRAPVERALADGSLWQYLGGDLPEEAAATFLAKWTVAPVLVTDRDQVGDCLDELLADLGGDPNPAAAIGIDIETAPDDWRPSPIKLKKDGGLYAKQPTVELGGLDPYRARPQTLQLYAGGERCFVFRGPALEEALSRLGSLGKLVAHHSLFEATFLRRYAGRHLPIECTMQAAGLLHGVHDRGLDDTARHVFNVAPPKDLQTSCWNAPHLSAGQIAYAATDAVLAYHLWPRLYAELQTTGRTAPYELQTGIIPAVADMQLAGMRVDLDEHRRQSDAWAKELSDLRRKYCDLAGKPPPSSPTELRVWIEAVAPEQVATGQWPRTGKTEVLSTKIKHVKRLLHTGDPTVKLVLRILALEKLISTFGPKLANSVNPQTGRIHAHYNISGSKAGRFTCSGPNLQQLPNARAPEFRKCIVPGPGNVLICCDWSQIELRAAAWITRDPVMTLAFADGLDLHRLAASAITGAPYDRVTEAQRKFAKPVNFGWIYGISAKALAENAFADFDIEMTWPEAQRALDRYSQKYPVLAQWRDVNAVQCSWQGRVDIGCGRIVKAEWEVENGGRITFNQACNLPIQGVCADLMLRALGAVHARLAGIDAQIVAVVHDEVLVEASEHDADRAKAILEESMVEAFEVTFPGAPRRGVAAGGIGPTWLGAKPG